MRNKQLNDIKEFIREGKANQFSTPNAQVPASADFFNRKRHQTKDVIKHINNEQRMLYNQLRDRSKDYFKNYAGKDAGPQISIAKEYNANRESPTFKHEQYSVDQPYQGPKHSVAGIQSIKYDIVNAGKQNIGGLTTDLYKANGKISLNKVSPISGFVNAASGDKSHMISEFRSALEKNPTMFRRRSSEKAHALTISH